MTINEKKICKVLWDYLCMHQNMKKSDIILVCGGHDVGVAKEAARLYNENYAPKVIVSGGIVREIFGQSKKALEADILGDLLVSYGVKKENIYYEREAKNTSENLELSEKLLNNEGILFNRVIMVQKPYAERRAMYLALKKWPNREIILTSEKTTFDNYFNSDIPERKIISMMVGEIQRLIFSPQFGWIDPVDIPQSVLDAYNSLCQLGYTERLMSDDVIQKCLQGTQDNISINAK